jgi:hypothetical protein
VTPAEALKVVRWLLGRQLWRDYHLDLRFRSRNARNLDEPDWMAKLSDEEVAQVRDLCDAYLGEMRKMLKRKPPKKASPNNPHRP